MRRKARDYRPRHVAQEHPDTAAEPPVFSYQFDSAMRFHLKGLRPIHPPFFRSCFDSAVIAVWQ